MKNRNAPVTHHEVPFPKDAVLISQTDKKGRITFANDAFVEISGFNRDELIGSNHNIVRHPDMPPQAFKWLWNTLALGRPWRGIVKNRCKNGNFYWVKATVAPVIENKEIVGYVSVRRQPSRKEISEAESLYFKLRSSGTTIESKFERYKFSNWSIAFKLQASIQTVLLIILTVAQCYILDHLELEARQVAMDQGEMVATEIIDAANMLMVSGQIRNGDTRQLLMSKITSSKIVSSARLIRAQPVIDLYGEGLPAEQANEEIHKDAIASQKTFQAFDPESNTMRIVTPYFARKDFHGTDCTGCHAAAEGTVLGISDVTLDISKEYSRINQLKMRMIMGQVGFQVLLYFLIAFLIRRYIRNTAVTVGDEFRHIMEGNLDTELNISGHDEMGTLLCAIQTLQTYLRTMVNEIATPVSGIKRKIQAVDAKVLTVAVNAADERERIKDIASVMDEFGRSVADVARMASESLLDAKTMHAIVDKNNRNMDLSIEAANEVSHTVQESSKNITDLGLSIQKIDTVTKSIKQIADQTNLLALNAAIEAARAGEHGRGFAIVADEVRKLASKTTQCTQDIVKTVQEIHSVSENAVKSMAHSVEKVASSIDLVRQNGEGLKEIRTASDCVAGRMEHIAMAVHEQAEAGQEVVRSLEVLESLVDSNTSFAQELKNVTRNLIETANELRHAGYPLTKCAAAMFDD